ncbi:glycosyltransferase family 2 protein [Enterococcus italicus]|uniref:glycosyltransferase family 2 protein n=1 Tax=Enterococcus italicus TaxID=246144 RepID=UPI003F481C7A
MDLKKVSIIIPMYNAEKSVKRCLESVLSQTYKNIEIICVNDGSTDQTSIIVNAFGKMDSRVIQINKNNEGVSSARNFGIKKATGHFVQFLDVDDALEKNATQKMVEEMNANNLDIVLCGYHDDTKTIEKSLPKEVLELSQLAEKFVPLYHTTYLNPPWNKMYIRENIQFLFPLEMSLGEDLVFNLKYLIKCKRIGIIPDIEYIYTMGQLDSLTTKYQRNAVECLENKIKCILEFLKFNEKEYLFDTLAEYFWNDYMRCINGMISCGLFNVEQLKKNFSDLRNTSTWKKCFSKFVPKEKDSIIFWNKEYDKYIRKVKRKSRIQKVKQNIKKVLSKMKEN